MYTIVTATFFCYKKEVPARRKPGSFELFYFSYFIICEFKSYFWCKMFHILASTKCSAYLIPRRRKRKNVASTPFSLRNKKKIRNLETDKVCTKSMTNVRNKSECFVLTLMNIDTINKVYFILPTHTNSTYIFTKCTVIYCYTNQIVSFIL